MNRSAPKVSVIVPVYRSLEHIQETITCLQNQSLRELELIFVDDKGNDGTFDIVKAAAAADPRIVCLENEVNSGPGVARNKGIEAARGEFIAFVDADDMITPDFYEKLYKKACETGALAVKAVRFNVEPDGKQIKNTLTERIQAELGNGHESMLNLWTYEHTAGIYSRDLVMKTGARNCDTARYDEDTCFLMMLMLHIKPSQIAVEEDAKYYYIQHEASLIHKPRDARYLEQVRLSAQFKIDFMMKQLQTHEHARYLADVIDSRLGWILNSINLSEVEESHIIQYIAYFANCVSKWYASGLPYFERESIQILRALHFNPVAFHSMRRVYRQFLIALTVPEIRKKLRKLKFRKLFAFGKKKTKYKNQIHHYRLLLREYNTFLCNAEEILRHR